MRNLTLIFVVTLFSSHLQAEDKVRKFLGETRDKVKETSEKAKSWGDHMESRNAEDIQEIDEKFKKTWANVEKSTEKAMSDVETESKLVTNKLEADWKAYKERRQKEPAVANAPLLPEADKELAGMRVYTKMNIDTYASTADATKFESFVKTFETALFQESLNIADSVYVKSQTGDTLLHSLVRQASALEKTSIRAKQVAQLQGKELPNLEANVSYKQTLLAISYFAESTKMGGVKNKAGQIPLDLLVQETPMSLNLARYLVLHDLSNASKARMNELFPSE